jgi:hypothetical protein
MSTRTIQIEVHRYIEVEIDDLAGEFTSKDELEVEIEDLIERRLLEQDSRIRCISDEQVVYDLQVW